MLPVKVSLNIKEEHDGEHLRLIVAADMKPVSPCYSFVLSSSCFYVVCVCTFVSL